MRKFLFYLILITFVWISPASATDTNARHYFNGSDDVSFFVDIQKGMTKENVRSAAKGTEYKAAESFQNGFAIAIDEKKTSFYNFQKWKPAPADEVDFFFSTKHLLVVKYLDGKVDSFQTAPLYLPEGYKP